MADALQEALVQDYGGLLRIAPAWPNSWDADATVYIQQNSKVDVQIRGGAPILVVIEAGTSGHVKMRNPWPGESLAEGNRVLRGGVVDIAIESGKSYALQPARSSKTPLTFAPVSASAATQPKSLGTRFIGVP